MIILGITILASLLLIPVLLVPSLTFFKIIYYYYYHDYHYRYFLFTGILIIISPHVWVLRKRKWEGIPKLRIFTTGTCVNGILITAGTCFTTSTIQKKNNWVLITTYDSNTGDNDDVDEDDDLWILN